MTTRQSVQQCKKPSIIHDYNHNVAVAVSLMYAEEIDNELGEKGRDVARPPDFNKPIEDKSRYVATRIKNIQQASVFEENHYEQWLHDRLCPCCKGDVFPAQTILTIIEAFAGVGKTSFVRIVLNDFAPEMSLSGKTKDQLEQHITFWGNVKKIYLELTAYSGDGFYVEFYEKLKTEILRHFPEINSKVTGRNWTNFIKDFPPPPSLESFMTDKNLLISRWYRLHSWP